MSKLGHSLSIYWTFEGWIFCQVLPFLLLSPFILLLFFLCRWITSYWDGHLWCAWWHCVFSCCNGYSSSRQCSCHASSPGFPRSVSPSPAMIILLYSLQVYSRLYLVLPIISFNWSILTWPPHLASLPTSGTPCYSFTCEMLLLFGLLCYFIHSILSVRMRRTLCLQGVVLQHVIWSINILGYEAIVLVTFWRLKVTEGGEPFYLPSSASSLFPSLLKHIYVMTSWTVISLNNGLCVLEIECFLEEAESNLNVKGACVSFKPPVSGRSRNLWRGWLLSCVLGDARV